MRAVTGGKRQQYEAAALRPFCDLLRQRGLQWHSGQGAENRIPIDGSVNFQFGDLRFSSRERHLVVEAESLGGVTNLAKY